jgi:hypothetical protein
VLRELTVGTVCFFLGQQNREAHALPVIPWVRDQLVWRLQYISGPCHIQKRDVTHMRCRTTFCQVCHLFSGLDEDDDECNDNWGPLILMGISALNATVGLTKSSADPFSPTEVPLISVLPPTPDTTPRNSDFQWDDSDLNSPPVGPTPLSDITSQVSPLHLHIDNVQDPVWRVDLLCVQFNWISLIFIGPFRFLCSYFPAGLWYHVFKFQLVNIVTYLCVTIDGVLDYWIYWLLTGNTTNNYNTIAISTLYRWLLHTLVSSLCYSVHYPFAGNGS